MNTSTDLIKVLKLYTSRFIFIQTKSELDTRQQL